MFGANTFTNSFYILKPYQKTFNEEVFRLLTIKFLAPGKSKVFHCFSMTSHHEKYSIVNTNNLPQLKISGQISIHCYIAPHKSPDILKTGLKRMDIFHNIFTSSHSFSSDVPCLFVFYRHAQAHEMKLPCPSCSEWGGCFFDSPPLFLICSIEAALEPRPLFPSLSLSSFLWCALRISFSLH